MGVGVGVGVVGVGVGLGVGAVTMSGEGGAGELAAAALVAGLVAELAGAKLARSALVGALEALDVMLVGDPTEVVGPADDEWLLVHAANAAAQSAATTQLTGLRLVVRSRLAIDSG